MGHYTKEKAISIVTACAKSYRDELADKSLLFVCLDKHKHTHYLEFSFESNNFLHLTGLKTKNRDDKTENSRPLTASEFYNRCLDGKLSPLDFDFAMDGTTELKLDVLPFVINKNLSANMIGDYKSVNPKLYTEKLVGGTKACVGFVLSSTSMRYIPNTVLKMDIRDYTASTSRVVAVFRKNKSDNKYSEVTYKAKKVDWMTIKYPDTFTYLSELIES